jgi:hypothetical protein
MAPVPLERSHTPGTKGIEASWWVCYIRQKASGVGNAGALLLDGAGRAGEKAAMLIQLSGFAPVRRITVEIWRERFRV